LLIKNEYEEREDCDKHDGIRTGISVSALHGIIGVRDWVV